VKISKPSFLFLFWVMAALAGVVIPMACTNTSSEFVKTMPSTPVVVSATATNAFGFTSTPTFTMQPTGTITNTPAVTSVVGTVTVTTICSVNVPNGLAVNSTSIFVAGGDGTLSIFPIGGGTASATLNQYGPTGAQFTDLSAVAIDPAGKLYVLDAGGSGNANSGTVYEFDTVNSNNPVTTWNNYNGQTFISPQGIAVYSAGAVTTVYVVDTGNNVVDGFTPNTLNGPVPIGQMGYPGGGGNGNFNNPTGIAIGTGSTVTIYVADMEDELIQEFNLSGTFVGQFATLPESFDPGVLGIAVDSGGHVYTADYNNSLLLNFNSTVSPATYAQWNGPNSLTNPFSPTGAALGAGSPATLYVSDYDNNAVYAVTPP
jgi:sugar lactone lactonase YvrE